MKTYSLSVFLIAATMCVFAHAAKDNAQLGAVMKVLSKDLAQLGEPTKATDPATVKDSVLLASVVRARTNAYLLQMIADRRGLVEKGALVEGELTPAGLDSLPADEVSTKLDLYGAYLMKAKLKMGEAEALIVAERTKSDPAARDFAPLKKVLDQLGLVIKEAHGVFKPASP